MNRSVSGEGLWFSVPQLSVSPEDGAPPEPTVWRPWLQRKIFNYLTLLSYVLKTTLIIKSATSLTYCKSVFFIIYVKHSYRNSYKPLTWIQCWSCDVCIISICYHIIFNFTPSEHFDPVTEGFSFEAFLKFNLNILWWFYKSSPVDF